MEHRKTHEFFCQPGPRRSRNSSANFSLASLRAARHLYCDMPLPIRPIFGSLVCLALTLSPAHASDLAVTHSDDGLLILSSFANAPFPHPARAEGHRHNNDFFSAAEHYQDSTVALFAPTGFHAGNTVDFVVHFHGWNNNVTNALKKYRLPDQFAASRRNAILIVPEGPRNADDSFGGKLEDPGGFARFMDEAMQTLRERQTIPKEAKIGRIILSGHSGGYEVISAIVACGGLTDHVQEVWLFDALYAHAERFALWFDHHPGRFIDLYTAHGGTKDETENLMTALTENHVPFFAGKEGAAAPEDLRRNRLVFLFSELPHDEVLQAHRTFQTFLETSGLKAVKTIYKTAPKP